MGEFSGRCALITGGGTGLGLEIGRSLAARGADIAIASRNPEHLERGLKVLQKEGTKVTARVCDVRDFRAVRRLVRELEADFALPDLLVNNAAGNFVRPAESLPEKAFANVVDIVLNGTFYLSRTLASRWIATQTPGVQLNIVATYAWTGGPGTVHSACAKAGVLAMTRTLAVEWARHGIRVVAVAPGPFDTSGASDRLWPSEELEQRVREAIPLGRFASREEVAEACAWLMAESGSYITGECLTMDGGAWLGKGIHAGDGVIEKIRRRRSRPAKQDAPGGKPGTDGDK